MEKLHFKAVHASVRPPRVAILVDKGDEDWQHTCLRIIEFYSQMWGGAYNIVIPTNGQTIDEQFWTILETFDPDYLYRYEKSGQDIYLNQPNHYNEILNVYVEEAIRGGLYSSDATMAKIHIDKLLREDWLSHFEIMPKLHQEIKTRLAPFWLEEDVVEPGSIRAGSSPHFPLTDLAKIILNTEHQDMFQMIEAPENSVPKLWFGAVTGLLSSAAVETFRNLGIECNSFAFREENLKVLIELVVTGNIRKARDLWPDTTVFNALPDCLPFRMSMLQLGLYRSPRYRIMQEPLMIVVGNTFEDFCLYYCLSRLRDRVVWMLPSITEKALVSNVDQPISRTEKNFIFEISNVKRSHKLTGGTASISYSLNSEQIDGVIQHLNQFGAEQLPAQIRKIDEVQSLIRFPLSAVERDNFQRHIPVQLSEDSGIIPFNTPKPKHFSPIHPYEHRYITQLSIPDESPPKHYELGPQIISGLTSYEARVGREGPAYFCPNIAYSGGDIDTALVRPTLRLPPLHKIMSILAQGKDYECRPSDKGIYADESILKWGGLEQIGAFLRNMQSRALLDRFMDDSKSQPGKGVYLSSDRRRYLDFPAINALVGDKATTLLDELISKQILYRGFIFCCTYCKNSDWFSVSDITQEFKCRRCGRSQIYTKRNWKQPDEPAWFYKLDELIYQGYRNGMSISVLALDYLRRNSQNSFTFTTDCEFRRPGSSAPEVEVDFFCSIDGVLTVGEAKKENNLDNSGSEEAAKIKKYKHLTSELAVRKLVFATLSRSWERRTTEAVKAAFTDVTHIKVLFLDESHLT